MSNTLERALSQPNVGGDWASNQGPGDALIEQELCRVQVDPQESRPWTVTLGQPNRRFVGNYSEEIWWSYATVEWGAGQVRHRVEVDWGQGCQFTVAGSFVVVKFTYPSTGLAPPAAELLLTQARAHIAPGISKGVGVVTRTVWYGTIAPGTFTDAPVPAFAKDCQVGDDCSAVDKLWNLRFLYAPLLTVAEYRVSAAASRSRIDVNQWLPVPANAIQARIINNQAVNTDYFVTYRLAL